MCKHIYYILVNITLSVPDKLYERMKKHSEYRWSRIAAQAFEKIMDRAEIMDELLDAGFEKNNKKIKEISNRIRKKELLSKKPKK